MTGPILPDLARSAPPSARSARLDQLATPIFARRRSSIGAVMHLQRYLVTTAK